MTVAAMLKVEAKWVPFGMRWAFAALLARGNQRTGGLPWN
jgi:hypothetical protein